MSENSHEGEFWSGPAGAKWIEHEAEQDHFLSGVAAAVIVKAGLKRGERVLDVGCGTGVVSMLAASAVGEGGHVLATDIAPPFVARVKERAQDVPQVHALLADAQSAVWPEPAFDVALSRFGVMFFADPAVAFANIAQALRPGGRIAFAAWGHTEDNPYWRIPRELIDRFLGPQPKPAPNGPGPMGLADADWAMARMREGGLRNVAVETREIPLLHEGGAGGAADLALRIGPAVRPLKEANAGPELIDRLRDAATEAFNPYEAGGQARIPATIHLYYAESG